MAQGSLNPGWVWSGVLLREPFLCIKACLCSQADSGRALVWKTRHQGAVRQFLCKSLTLPRTAFTFQSEETQKQTIFTTETSVDSEGLEMNPEPWKFYQRPVNLIKLLTLMGLASGKVWNSFLDPQGPLVSWSLSGGFCFGPQHANFTLHIPSFQDIISHFNFG